jgi:RNA polymerase sigma factor (sigma-70 family)
VIAGAWSSSIARSLEGRTLDRRDTRARIAELAERDLTRAYRLAGLILGDANEAEEAVADALERALRHADELRDPERFRAWFDRILTNACRDRLRRRRGIRLIAMPDDVVDRQDPFRNSLARDEALREIAALEPDERIVVVLHFWADLTLDDIATRLGWPAGTVRSRFYRGLERLRRGRVGTPGPRSEP